MADIETAISIDRELFDEGERLARELNVSRSDLYSRALQGLLRQRRRQSIADRINEAQASLTDEERADEQRLVDGLGRAFGDTLRLYDVARCDGGAHSRRRPVNARLSACSG